MANDYHIAVEFQIMIVFKQLLMLKLMILDHNMLQSV